MAELFLRSGETWAGKVFGAESAKPYAMIAPKCGRCGGGGRLDCFRHVEGGICFECNGTRFKAPKANPLYTAEKLAKLTSAAAKKSEAKAAKFAAERKVEEAKVAARREAFEAEFAAELAWLEVVATDANEESGLKPGFLGDMLAKARKWSEWSEGMAAAVKAAKAKYEAELVTKAASKFVGEVGKRIEAVVTVEREASFWRKGWGYSGEEEVFITTLRTADGAALVVMSPAFREAVGSVLKIKGTVKELKVFRDEKQTVLNRVTVVETVSSPVESPATEENAT